jgi:hypothetical protein
MVQVSNLYVKTDPLAISFYASILHALLVSLPELQEYTIATALTQAYLLVTTTLSKPNDS